MTTVSRANGMMSVGSIFQWRASNRFERISAVHIVCFRCTAVTAVLTQCYLLEHYEADRADSLRCISVYVRTAFNPKRQRLRIVSNRNGCRWRNDTGRLRWLKWDWRKRTNDLKFMTNTNVRQKRFISWLWKLNCYIFLTGLVVHWQLL